MARMNVRLNEDLYGRLLGAAKSRGCPLSRLVRDLLSAGLEDSGAKVVEASEEGNRLQRDARLAARTLDAAGQRRLASSARRHIRWGGGDADKEIAYDF